MTLRQLWFNQPRQLEIRELTLPHPAHGQVRVRTACSAISAGTEMLIYRGQLPQDLALDGTLASLQRAPSYPLPYGYACVGDVERIGPDVDESWLGKRVFSFQPHASHFLARPAELLTVPDRIAPEAALFLANMETAVNLVQDGKPMLGERVVVIGQGIVGLLVTSLLARFPLAWLATLEGIRLRRELSQRLGANQVVDPAVADQLAELSTSLGILAEGAASAISGADLIYEVSGAPEALNRAVELAGYAGRIVIGSWYGTKQATLNLGGTAHRNRLRIMTSQVSTLAPELGGRWDKSRRFQVAWDMIRRVRPEEWISHRLPIEQASAIYQQLDEAPDSVLQAVLTY